MPGRFIKGALVGFVPSMLEPVPNVIAFQFNPDTIRHTWTQPEGIEQESGSNPLAVRGMPGESFSFSLVMDANDAIAEGQRLAQETGIYSRLAALELLMYPTQSLSGGLLGSVSLSVSVGGGGVGASVGVGGSSAEKRRVPASEVSTVLFVWGPGRIVPVRVTSLTINETLYDTRLNPTHAEASLELRVLTPEELAWVSGPISEVARAAYAYSQSLREGLAVANLSNAAESILGMIPV